MKPDNIYRPDHALIVDAMMSQASTADRLAAFRRGWQQSSRWLQLLAASSSLLLIALSCALLWQGQWTFCTLFNVPVLWGWYFASQGRRVSPCPALLPYCQVRDGQCFIGDTQLPATLSQVALGIVPGGSRLGYLQLAWNGGLQWTFPPEELNAIRSWLLQHYPNLKMVS